MEKLVQKFGEFYEYIYETEAGGKEVPGVRAAVVLFDEVILKTSKELVEAFNSYRGDFISSDREAAAFVFACEALRLL